MLRGARRRRGSIWRWRVPSKLVGVRGQRMLCSGCDLRDVGFNEEGTKSHKGIKSEKWECLQNKFRDHLNSIRVPPSAYNNVSVGNEIPSWCNVLKDLRWRRDGLTWSGDMTSHEDDDRGIDHLFPLSPPDNSTKMTPSGPPSILEIWKIARRTTDIIESEITSNVCVFGSAAVSLCADIDHAPKVRHWH